MSVENEPVMEPPTCSVCGTEMEFRGKGTTKSIPVVGEVIEFQQFSCPECGQGTRFERRSSETEWSRPVE